MRNSAFIRSARLAIAAAALAGLTLAAPAQAQRDPAYAAARANGTIGEKTDGYLAIVSNGSAALRAVVDDINIKRRAVYTEKARATNSTVEQYAFTAGCINIARTSPGEKYELPGGGWATRTSGAPTRDPRCP
jgi:uncharacterized protein YdbL (DUF1318 family)